jgi:hypothetical protein
MTNGTAAWASVVLAASFLVLALLVGLWDAYMGYRFGPEYTVSYIVQGWAGRFPILVLLIGLVLGHLFWPLPR